VQWYEGFKFNKINCSYNLYFVAVTIILLVTDAAACGMTILLSTSYSKLVDLGTLILPGFGVYVVGLSSLDWNATTPASCSLSTVGGVVNSHNNTVPSYVGQDQVISLPLSQPAVTLELKNKQIQIITAINFIKLKSFIPLHNIITCI
jgi:sugar phosphate permease